MTLEKWLIKPGETRVIDLEDIRKLKVGLVGGQIDVVAHDEPGVRIEGDVQFAAAESVVDAITPVPGGVGTVTTSVLVGHVVQAACKKAGVEC